VWSEGFEGERHLVAFVHVTLAPVEHRAARVPVLFFNDIQERRLTTRQNARPSLPGQRKLVWVSARPASSRTSSNFGSGVRRVACRAKGDGAVRPCLVSLTYLVIVERSPVGGGMHGAKNRMVCCS
jgi:hypothetical protein